MKTRAILAALLATAGLVAAAEQAPEKPAGKVPDLTQADAKTFKAHIGRVVSLRGRLEQGVQGPCLHGATPEDVAFYVVPDMPASGSYTYPAIWTRLTGQQMRITGELKFRSFPKVKGDARSQTPPDFYYVVSQRATLEPIEAK